MPEPVLVAIAASLAAKSVASLFDLVKRKFTGKPEAAAVLAAAQGGEPNSAEVQALSEELANAEQEDPAFGAELRALWHEVTVEQRADGGGVANQISGEVRGHAVQARDIQGGVSF